MNFELNAAFSLSIGIGAVTGWIRIRKTDPAFLPFLFLLLAGFINEIISIVVMKAGYSNVVFYNIFSLLEGLLITLQFRRWGLFESWRKQYYIIMLLFMAVWTAEVVFKSHLRLFNSVFIIFYSALIVLMSINMLNRVIFKEPPHLFFNPVFLICMGFIIYFTYAILVEAFWVYGLNQSKEFRIGVYSMLAYVNLFTNLLFASATIWIPLKRQYILRS
jgi:hypothetical protein